MRNSGTVKKALSVLDEFLDGSDSLSLSELAGRTRMHKSTLLRLCVSLEEAGLLKRASAGGAFRLGPKVGQLAQVYKRVFRLEDAIRPLLRRVRDATGESVSFYVAEGDERVCLFRENSGFNVRHHLDEGARMPLDSGVVGRVLAAFGGAAGAEFEAIRKSGFLSATGREPYTKSVAAPVFQRSGRLLGALVVSGPSERFRDTGQALELIQEASAEISRLAPA